MVDIQSVAAEIRRGKKKKIEDRKKLQGKNIMAPLLHRAAITRNRKHQHVAKSKIRKTAATSLPVATAKC